MEDDIQRDILQDRYEEYRAKADELRAQGEAKKAAAYYEKCADAMADLAATESSDSLAEKRRDLAQNLANVAERLRDSGSLDATEQVDDMESGDGDAGASDDAGSGGGSGSPDADASDGSDADSESVEDAGEYLEPPPDLDFEDVGGMHDLKETLRDKVIDPLERSDLYAEYDLGVVNGVMLYGPPGTGKTYITRALAGKLGYNFVDVEPNDITSSLVGEAADNVSELYDVARDNQPCLVFIDEVDALMPSRSGGSQKTQSERQMVNQFLTELTETRGEDVITVTATNIPDEVDGAATSRFQERIEVPPPGPEAREAILRVHLRNRPALPDEIDWERIRESTEGYSGRDLEVVADDAALAALQEAVEDDEIRHIRQEHLEQALAETDPSLDHWSG
ncbi:ATP-binding protein [Haloplanus halophilus]|uniref:ATP-binding protein n=1 Tax=Haloplanus halophilus TaxID=2949993 RepID=UPI002041290A|nr:ATP-binding protein [Haloplanus sp. GDY1]